jgi:DNA-binding IclR family transcriptional regulator
MTRNQIDKAVTEVREKGLARAVEKPIPGVNAFSAPAFDHSGSIALAITAIGPSHTFNADWDGPIAEEVRKCAATVSMRLGFSSNGSRAA